VKQLARSIWRFSWLITLPVSVLYLYCVWATVERFYVFKVRFDPAPSVAQLHEFGTTEFMQLIRRWKLAWVPKFDRRSEASPQIRDISLYVPQSQLAQLDSHLPYSGFEYVGGGLLNGHRVQEVDVRYRGDHLQHWGFYKKSYRIKTKKSELFEGMRTFNLNVPMFGPHIQNHVSYKLADKMQLIAPRSELVNVVLNGERRGIHILIEQPNELTLRRHDLIPGDLYAGELVAKDSYPGIEIYVWDHPGLWQKKAFNNHYPEESREPLRRLIELVNAVPSTKVEAELDSLLDVEAWGRFAAFETLSQSFHYTRSHNWRLYFDPARSLFVPVVWDPMAWSWSHDAAAQLDVLTTRLQARLCHNGNILRERHRAIEEFYSSGAKEEFLQQVDVEVATMESSLADDPNLLPVDPGAIVESMREYKRTMARILEEVERGYLAETGTVEYVVPLPGQQTIPISFGGRSPVKSVMFQYVEPLQDAVSACIRYWRNGRRVEVDLAGALYQSANQLKVTASLLPNLQFAINESPPTSAYPLHLVPQTAYYEFEIEGIGGANRLLDVLVDRGREGIARAQPVPKLDRHSFREVHAIVDSPSSTVPVKWRGDIELSGVTHIDAPLILEPGTTVRLKSGATLIFHNRLIAEGTAEKPISFRPAEADQESWGAVAILGPSASGSILEHCIFSGGSGLKGDLFEYSGMLSIHDAGRVDIAHCRFRDNKLVDDVLHAVYSEVHLRDCTFARAAGDAVDLDLCRATIVNCRFEESGNDGVDLMGSHAVVTTTLFRGNRDKGISVGEKSRLLAIDNRFARNDIGVQSKDASVAILYNIDFEQNRLAVDAYLKNWRYNIGGRAYVYKSRLRQNQQTLTADRQSQIQVYDSYSDVPIDAKRVTLDSAVDSQSTSRASRNRRYSDSLQRSVWIEDRFWDRAYPARRGSVNVIE